MTKGRFQYGRREAEARHARRPRGVPRGHHLLLGHCRLHDDIRVLDALSGRRPSQRPVHLLRRHDQRVHGLQGTAVNYRW